MIDGLEKLSAIEAAPLLLGWVLERTLENGQVISGQIVETESYHQDDPAAHSFRGQTPRNSVMFGPAGHAYVYFTYGMHYCFNVVTGPVGRAEAVLIRAIEPIRGIELIQERRGSALRPMQLTNGPAKLTQALAIGSELNGHDLCEVPLRLLPSSPVPPTDIVRTTRIGISRATEALERYYIRDNLYVSRP